MCLFRNNKINKINNNLLEILKEFFNRFGSNKKDGWKPSIMKISKVAIEDPITRAIKESKIKMKNINEYVQNYLVYQLSFYIYKKVLYSGNTMFILNKKIPVNNSYKSSIEFVDTNKDHEDGILIIKFNNVISNMKNTVIPIDSTDSGEHYILDLRFNLLLKAIIESIDFTTIILEIMSDYKNSNSKLKDLRNKIMGEELVECYTDRKEK